jgi:hypothetical protein
MFDNLPTAAARSASAKANAVPLKADKIDRRDAPGGAKKPWTCVVIFQTNRSTTLIEHWLEENASGEWSVVLDDIDEALEAKTVKIFFANRPNKAAFAAHFAQA